MTKKRLPLGRRFFFLNIILTGLKDGQVWSFWISQKVGIDTPRKIDPLSIKWISTLTSSPSVNWHFVRYSDQIPR